MREAALQKSPLCQSLTRRESICSLPIKGSIRCLRKEQVESEVADLTTELRAVDAYHAAKGDGSLSKASGRSRKLPAKARKSSGRQSGMREQVLSKIKEAADGIARGELLIAMEMKGNKSGELAVSNALAALKKAGKAIARDGKYLVGG
jgi:hypothetical protein